MARQSGAMAGMCRGELAEIRGIMGHERWVMASVPEQ